MAKKMYAQKKDHFMKLTAFHHDESRKWYFFDRKPVLGRNGIIQSVYKHTTSKGETIYTYQRPKRLLQPVPSLDSEYQRLLSKGETLRVSVVGKASFLREGILIQTQQYVHFLVMSFKSLTNALCEGL